jgi:hypothetical protein
LKLIVEILRLNGAHAPEILHVFTHSASSIHIARESLKGVATSPAWPLGANGFRIMSAEGAELYRWPE